MHPFEVMAEPVRRRIIEILASGEHAAGIVSDAIVNEYQITQPAVSWHLRILLDAEFVTCRPDWPNRLYSLDVGGLERLEDHVAELRQRYDDAPNPLAAIQRQRAAPGTVPGSRERRPGRHPEAHRDTGTETNSETETELDTETERGAETSVRGATRPRTRARSRTAARPRSAAGVDPWRKAAGGPAGWGTPAG